MARSVKRSEAEIRFSNAQKRMEDARKAVTEQQAADQAIRERTARLRGLRLAKEAAEKEEAAKQSRLKPATKKRGANARRELEKTTAEGRPEKQSGSSD